MKDVAGNALAANVTWTFTTGSRLRRRHLPLHHLAGDGDARPDR